MKTVGKAMKINRHNKGSETTTLRDALITYRQTSYPDQPNQPKNLPDEIIGMEYLYLQNQMTFNREYITANIDDGIEGEDEDSGIEDGDMPEEIPITEERQEEVKDGNVREESTDAMGIHGWKKVDVLAHAFIELNGISVSMKEKKTSRLCTNNLMSMTRSRSLTRPW